jgi:hypothetical protein
MSLVYSRTGVLVLNREIRAFDQRGHCFTSRSATPRVLKEKK